MRRLIPLLLIVACGNPISGASNCTELYQATLEAVADLPDSNIAALPDDEQEAALDAFYAASDELTAKVAARADELVGPAIERGADTEAALCLQAVDETYVVAEVFDTVAP